MNDKDMVKKAKNNKLLSTQRYLQVSSIHDDTLVLKDGGARAILEVNAVNFDLKSDEEQNALILSYQHFLNALDFPVQTLVRSRKLDIDSYIEMLEEKKGDQNNDLLQTQMGEYIEYIQRLVEATNIMEKKFFVVVPQTPLRAVTNSVFSKFLKYISPSDDVAGIIKRKREFKELTTKLDARINVVKTGLENCGLAARRLETGEIIELFYQAHNPDISRYQKMEYPEDLAPLENPQDSLVEADEPKKEKKKEAPKESKIWKVIKWMFIIVFVLIVVIVGAYFIWYWTTA